ncbi:uncharacterized protein LOC141695890 [Apium graveolens]|uniref:uncharacterized protein LOC141695890 n=1 Tax=Apium graveolens TaxID=4045 RepID=UPI003D7AEEB2
MEIFDSIDDEPNKERLTHKAPMKPYIPLIPFPQRLKNSNLEKHIPFANALAQMPLYVKFMKEVLSNRNKLKEVETITLTEKCSVVIQYTIPPKLKDPGSFSLPCTIGELGIRKALYDLGASVDKFVIPCDFVVLEMNEDVDIPIILGRPLLATAETNIDVKAGKLTLNVGKERVDFDLDQSMKELSVKTECYVVNVVK